eukprot:TRINITY_DN1566_c0_g1_i11.p3 TRINITY_DN1566_c0_g1~~TRINITY_DN1566_c0_g1_i11.p3  ORF type:complete len:207 (-),score=-17.90 TRINITY_DN1566_c0_g1_i11:2210-2830(-)
MTKKRRMLFNDFKAFQRLYFQHNRSFVNYYINISNNIKSYFNKDNIANNVHNIKIQSNRQTEFCKSLFQYYDTLEPSRKTIYIPFKSCSNKNNMHNIKLQSKRQIVTLFRFKSTLLQTRQLSNYNNVKQVYTLAMSTILDNKVSQLLQFYLSHFQNQHVRLRKTLRCLCRFNFASSWFTFVHVSSQQCVKVHYEPLINTAHNKFYE